MRTSTCRGIRFLSFLLTFFLMVLMMGCAENTTRLYTVQGTGQYAQDGFQIALESMEYDYVNDKMVYRFVVSQTIRDSLEMGITPHSFITEIGEVRYGVGAPYENCTVEPDEGTFFEFRMDGNAEDLETFPFASGQGYAFSVAIDVKAIIALYTDSTIASEAIGDSRNCLGLYVYGHLIIFGDFNLF